jgi:hypothetical protein
MSLTNLSLKLNITDSWVGGFNGQIIIENKNSSLINFYLEFRNSKTTITWCDFLITKQSKYVKLSLQSWSEPLKPNSNTIFKFGGTGIVPKVSNFKIKLLKLPPVPKPDPDPGPIPNPIIKETPVDGLPNTLCNVYNLNDIIDLTKNTNIKIVYFSNKNILEKTQPLKLRIKDIGTSCLKIVFNDDSFRLFGIYVNGFEKMITTKVKIGSVSEDDPSTSIKFWSDFEDDPKKNKYCELRYIYLNNGPGDYGWRYNYSTPQYNLEPLGQRAFKFIRNSFRLGMIPCFIYYNIPDSGESYFTNLSHIQDRNYMKNYYTDLKFLLDIINTELGTLNIPIYIIFEPDFLGYIMQNSGKGNNNPYYKYPSEIQAYVNPVYELGYLDKSKEIFNDTLSGLVNSINFLCKKYCSSKVKIGWQINVWSSTYSGKVIPGGLSLMKSSDTIGLENGKKLIINEATEIANFYKLCGITNNTDFFSVDKYGLSFRGVTLNDLTNAIKSNWGWNHDHWMNYLLYCKTLGDVLNQKCILWQIPSSHLNSSQSINPITNKKYIDISNIPGSYEDSSMTFFLGDTFIPKIKIEEEYWKKNEWNSKECIINNNMITWNSMMNKLLENNIFCMLCGAGVGNDTHSGGLSRSITDDYFFISKVQNYYFNNS